MVHALDATERAAILDTLLADHPDLVRRAEALARQVLDDVDEDAVAAEVVKVYLGMEIQRIGDRMGRQLGGGYVDENEAAWALLEEALEPFLTQITRRGRLGFTDTARRYATGVLAGLDDLRTDAGEDTVFGWASPDETADELGWSVRHAAEQAGAHVPDQTGTEPR
ncbi:hypothetical protein BH23ACT10_BH23ACT10_19740 [soil metagenome]